MKLETPEEVAARVEEFSTREEVREWDNAQGRAYLASVIREDRLALLDDVEDRAQAPELAGTHNPYGFALGIVRLQQRGK